MSEFAFKKPNKKTPLWKEIFSFCLMVFGIWGGTHLVMNYSAYSEIVTFRYSELKTSVIMDLETMAKEETVKLTKVKTNKHKRQVVHRASDLTKSVKKLPKVKKEIITFRKKELKPRNQAKKTLEKMSIFPSDNRLVIPRIGKNVPLISVPEHKNWKQLEKGIQKGLQNGVVVHPISHDPGSFGNFFLTGHSSYYAWDKGRFKDVFALLHEVNAGDIVDIYWEGKKYSYKMTEKKVVAPTEVEILKQPTDEKKITLMTCTPVGTNTNRLILVGELKSED